MAHVSIANRMIRWTAALAAALLVAGCGTRLDDARIEAAAGVGQSATADGLAASPGAITGDLAASTGTESAAAAPGQSAGNDTGNVAGAAGSGTVSATPGAAQGAGPSGGPAKAGNAPSARASAGSATAAGSSGGAATAGPASAGAGSASDRPGTTPGAPTPTPGAGGAATAKAPIILGHIGDYSGLIGTLMKGGDVTAQVIARHVNDTGGLDGHPVKVIVGDAGGDPARALSLARDMVENKGAIAFMGTLMVFSGYGPRDYLEERKIPIIGGDGTTGVWLQSPMYFTSSANFPGISAGALKGLADLGKKKVAVFHCVEAEQCKTWHDTAIAKADSYGVKIVYQAQISLAQPDFTAECIQAQRSGADGVMTGMDGPSIVRFVRSCVQQGYRPQYMTASLAVIDSIAKDPNLEGLKAPQGVFPYMATDLPAQGLFRSTMARYAPGVEISPAVATVWTGGVLLREVSKKLPDGKVGPADFFPGLYAIKANTLGGLVGPLTFNAGSTAGEVRCVFFIKVAGGRWTAPDGSKQHCF